MAAETLETDLFLSKNPQLRLHSKSNSYPEMMAFSYEPIAPGVIHMLSKHVCQDMQMLILI